MEALRDAICRLLADDPTLTEGDIAVMSPQIDVFVPSIEAAFGPSVDESAPAPSDGRPPALRYRITDRSVRAANPVLGAMATLLELVPGRFTASGVTEMLALAPVRRRFGLSTEDLSLLDRWIGDTNVRWGLDAEGRRPWGLPRSFEANTWDAGLDQLLMGVALTDGALVLGPDEIAPGRVEGSDVPSAARLARAVRTIGAVAAALAAPRPSGNGATNCWRWPMPCSPSPGTTPGSVGRSIGTSPV